MADEQQTIAPTEQDTPAISQVANETPIEQGPVDEPERILSPDEVARDELNAEAGTIEDDFEELEWNGKTFKAPKGLKDGVLMQADYTKKTQTVAEKAKALESREAEITQRLEATDEELKTKAVLINVDERLQAYAKLNQADWDAYYAQDYVETDKAWRDYQMLKEQRGEIAKTLEAKQSERTQKAELDLANRVEETRAFAAKEIPGWKPEVTETLVKLALDLGVPEDALKKNWSPTFYKLLHRAHIGTLTLEKQTTASRLNPLPIQPLEVVGGKSTPGARTDLASADMEAYVAARKKGVGGKPLR